MILSQLYKARSTLKALRPSYKATLPQQLSNIAVFSIPSTNTSYRISLIFLVLFLASCSQTPREEQLRNTINTMQNDLEESNIGDFQDNISEEFLYNQQRDKNWLRQVLLSLRFRNKGTKLKVVTSKVHIEMDIDESKADATINGFVASLKNISIEEGRQFSLETQWYYESNQWFLYRVKWDKAPSLLDRL